MELDDPPKYFCRSFDELENSMNSGPTFYLTQALSTVISMHSAHRSLIFIECLLELVHILAAETVSL
jgi:hypothetical protein